MLTVSSPRSFSIMDVDHRLARRLPPLLSAMVSKRDSQPTHATASEWLYAIILSSPPMSRRNLSATGTVRYEVKSAVPFQSNCCANTHGRGYAVFGYRFDS